MVTTNQKIGSALVAALFLTVGFSVLAPASAAPADVGGGVTIDVLAPSWQLGDGPLWLSAAGQAHAVSVVLDRPGETPPIDTVFVGLQFPETHPQGDQFAYANTGAVPDGWSAAEDPQGGLLYEAPTPDLVCTQLGEGCPNLPAGGHTFDLTLTPDAGATDFAAVPFIVLASGGGYQSDDDAGFLLGFDATAPVVTQPVVSGWSGGLATITFDVTDATSGVASVTVSQGTLDCGDLSTVPTSASCTVTGVDPGAANSFTADASDAAGNAATQMSIDPLDGTLPVIDQFDLVGGTQGAGGFYTDTTSLKAVFQTSDGPSGVASVSYSLDGGSTFQSTPATDGDGEIDLSALADGSYALVLRATDFAGNHADSATEDFNVGDPGDLVATTTAVSDAFVRAGQSVTITSTTVHAPDTPDAGSGYAFARVTLFDGETAVATKTTNSAGVAQFVVSSASVVQKTYVARAVGYALDAERVVTELGDATQRTEDVVYTRLQTASFTTDASVLGRGEEVTLQLSLVWEHDGSIADGLSMGAVYAGIQGQGGGDDPRALLPAVPSAGSTNGGWGEPVPGTYTLPYSHAQYESLRFVPTSGPIGDNGLGGATTTFDVPATSPAFVHWIGAYVESVDLANADDGSDPTGGFVDLDDTVEATARVVYTPNYDPAAVDGLLADGAAPVAVEGATVALFEASHLDVAYVAQPNALTANTDAVTTAATDAAGDAVFTLDENLFSQALLRDGANAYGLRFLPTDIPGATNDQSIVQANAADLDSEADLTFTALDLAYVTDSLTGSSDPASGTADGTEPRWWFSMDDRKGDADADPGDADAASLGVHVTWRHDGSDAASAAVRLLRSDAGSTGPAAFLTSVGDTPTVLEAVTGASGLATLTLDPDDYALDALVTSLEAVAVGAPEPAEPLASITQAHDTFVQEFLWTRVALFSGIEPTSDAEVNLADDVGVYAIPVYYHREGNAAGAYHFNAAYGLADAATDRISAAGNVILADTALFPGAVTAADDTVPASLGIPSFLVSGGCTDLAACAATAHPDQAGYHTYVATLDTAPNGLAVDDGSVDVLYTAVVVDARTDRLTTEVGQDVLLSAQAFYAHTHDAAGDVFADAGFGAGNLPFTGDVTADITVDGVPVDQDVVLTGGALTDHVIPGRSAAGHYDVLVDTADASSPGAADGSLAHDGTTVPLTRIYDSATLERVWLGLGISGVDVDRSLQVRGRDVTASFEVTYTDGGAPVEVTGTNAGYAFTADDANAATRFSRTPSTQPSTLAPAASVVLPVVDGVDLDFPAAYDGGCGCWQSVLTGFDAVTPAAQVFDVGASVRLTEATADDLATTVSAADAGAIEVTFTALQLSLPGTDGAHQTDLDEFWYDLGDGGVLTLTAAWAHDGSAATGASLVVEDPALPGSPLAGVGVVDNADGTYTVTVPSPAQSERRTYTLGVAGIPSTAAGEDPFTDAAPFSPGADSLALDTSEPVLVHTRIDFDWLDAYDGTYVNRGQSRLFSFGVAWEHDGTYVDVPHGFFVDAGGEEFVVAVSPDHDTGTSLGDLDVVRSTSQAVTFSPSVYTDGVDAPRGIELVDLLDGVVTVTWTAILVDVDDSLHNSIQDVGVPVPVRARASLEHDAATFLEDVQVRLAGSVESTVADRYSAGVPGAGVDIVVLQSGPLTVFGEGRSYAAGAVAGNVLGGTAITASTDDSVDMTFE